MTIQQQQKQLSKFLSYVLGRHPEEFGLIPDEYGYVKIRELLKALHETDGWRHIRESSIKELLLVETDPPIEISENLVRAKDRRQLPKPLKCDNVPKILYTCVRKKAYPHVAEKGVSPTGEPHVICSPDSETALRLGRRKDSNAVLLTIQTAKVADRGFVFHQFTDVFHLAEQIPPGTFIGPPLPKAPEKEKSAKPATQPPKEVGTFTVTPKDLEFTLHKRKGKKKKIDWKQSRKHRKKQGGGDSWPDDF